MFPDQTPGLGYIRYLSQWPWERRKQAVSRLGITLRPREPVPFEPGTGTELVMS